MHRVGSNAGGAGRERNEGSLGEACPLAADCQHRVNRAAYRAVPVVRRDEYHMWGWADNAALRSWTITPLKGTS